ncbi:alpha/beta hydrolase [Streptomyces sp. CRN 30]|uniref:alpha/beta hydrolase n=1 Tax=Streptomyces sp. CRN 30 TaxID=3075613 RepID=UPI002A813C4F|nr:alpha/beta hydrolase [Streptomyces sp. CRN 30]
MTEYTDHHAPEGLLTRGTVLVVPGRGETPATYGRLGRRLAADAYRVRVVAAPDLDAADLDGSLTRLGARLAEAVEGAAVEGDVARPVVLVGADTGAAAVAALLGRGAFPGAVAPDAVVLAGLPGGSAAASAATWEEELDVRTSCPTHRAVLTDDSRVRRGSLDDAVPEALLAAADAAVLTVPALLLAGDADPLADHAALARTAAALPRARYSLVRGAHHDVLNDLQHRSVAAEVVTFLETLRNELRPLIAVESSSW